MALYEPQSFYESTLAVAIAAGDTTIAVTTAPTITAGFMVLEANTSNREIIKYTGVTGTNLTGCVRGLSSTSSDQSAGTGKAHAAGIDVAMRNVHFYETQRGGSIFLDYTGHDYTNSNAENNLLTSSIAGGTLGTVSGIEFKVFFTAADSANGTWTFKLKYGSTTIATSTTLNTGTTITEGIVEGVILAAGTTANQVGTLRIIAGEAAVDGKTVFDIATGTATEDSTGALTLAITSQGSAATADISTKYGYIRKL